MITVTVTSDSSVPELHMARRAIIEMVELRSDVTLGVANVDKRRKPSLTEICEEFKVPQPPSRKTDLTVKIDASDAIKEIEKVRDEISDILHGNNPTHVIVDEVFNATELAEAETMGKPVCSTVDASQSTTAHADTQVNTSLPEPTSVFGQAAQTTVNEANLVVQSTPDPVVDGDGLLWDKRIHSSSRELNKDGTWRKRRGVADELVRQVESELRGHTSVVAEAYANVTGKTIEQAKHELNNGASVHSYNGGELVAIDANGVEHDTKPSLQPLTFTELLDGVTKAMVAGQLSQERINGALASIGLTALPNLLGNPALIPAFREALGGVV